MTSDRLRDFLAATPGATWILMRACVWLLAREDDPAVLSFLARLKAECERHATDAGHLIGEGDPRQWLCLWCGNYPVDPTECRRGKWCEGHQRGGAGG